jgi:hypothetical protein
MKDVPQCCIGLGDVGRGLTLNHCQWQVGDVPMSYQESMHPGLVHKEQYSVHLQV